MRGRSSDQGQAGLAIDSFAILGLTFLVYEFFVIMVYSFIGAKLGRHIRKGRALAWFNRTSGAMMIGFGLARVFASRPTAWFPSLD